MSAIGRYLLSVAAVGLLTSLAQSLIPKGPIRRTASFLGGLLLFLAVLSPILHLQTEDLALAMSKLRMETQDLQSEAELQNRELTSRLIKEQCEAYILDKAAELGVHPSVEVEMREEDFYPYPWSVSLSGGCSAAVRQSLEKYIEEDLGIPRDRQVWSGT